jgi:hypothetical protein
MTDAQRLEREGEHAAKSSSCPMRAQIAAGSDIDAGQGVSARGLQNRRLLLESSTLPSSSCKGAQG